MRRPGNGGFPWLAKAGVGGHPGGAQRVTAFNELRPHVHQEFPNASDEQERHYSFYKTLRELFQCYKTS